MKTLLIEQVTNGFIVRPFSACEGWARGECVDISVYKTVEELAADLPRLLTNKTETEI